MLGVELVTDRQLKTPAKDEICQAMEHMKGTSAYYSYLVWNNFFVSNTEH